MKASTTSAKRILSVCAGAVFWLALWQAAAILLSQSILLCTPAQAFFSLCGLLSAPDFWLAAAFTLSRIAAGFLSAVFWGTLLAAAAHRLAAVRCAAEPAMAVLRASPVASFIILLLVWVPARRLCAAAAFIMALPLIYSGVQSGINEVSAELLEMARVFRIPFSRRIRYIYISQIMPFFRTACETSLGLCFKAGIAAEVIATPTGSIGERLYMAKIYLETPELFALTAVIVLLSIAITRLFSRLLDIAVSRLERM